MLHFSAEPTRYFKHLIRRLANCVVVVAAFAVVVIIFAFVVVVIDVAVLVVVFAFKLT